MPLGPKEIKWLAPEFEYYNKDVSWYWLVIIIASLIVVFSIWSENFLFALFAVMAALLIMNWGHRQPRKIEFILNTHGLAIDQKKNYSYQSFQGFAEQAVNNEWTEIIFKGKNKLSPYLKILIDNRRAPEAKNLINRFLPEIEYEESIADHIAKLLKF